MGWDVFVCLVS